MRLKHLLLCGIAIVMMSFSAIGQTLLPKQNEKGKFGYVDQAGNWIINAKYTEAGQFAGNFAFVKKDKKFGLINTSGQELVKPKYKYIITLPSLSSSIFCNDVKNNESEFFNFANGFKFNVSNHNIVAMTDWYSVNEFRVYCSYDENQSPAEKAINEYKRSVFGVPQVYADYKCLDVNLKKPYEWNGKKYKNMLFTNVKYNSWEILDGGATILAEGNVSDDPDDSRWMTKYLIKDGEVVLTGNIIRKGGEYYLKKKKPITYYVRSSDGKCILDDIESSSSSSSIQEYDAIRAVGENYILLKKDGVWTFKPKFGCIEEYVFKNPGDTIPLVIVYEGMLGKECIIKDNGKYGIYREKIILPCEYDSVYAFGDRKYQVEKAGKAQLYSSSYNKFYDFVSTKYKVKFSTNTLDEIIITDKATNKDGFIKDGKIIVPAVNDSIEVMAKYGSDYIYCYCRNGVKYMFNSSNGKVIADGKRYDSYRIARNGLVYVVKKGKKVGLIDAKNGKLIAPIAYDDYQMYGSKGNHIMSTTYGTKTTLTVYDINGIKKTTQTFVNDGLRKSVYRMAAFMQSWCGGVRWDEGYTADDVFIELK